MSDCSVTYVIFRTVQPHHSIRCPAVNFVNIDCNSPLWGRERGVEERQALGIQRSQRMNTGDPHHRWPPQTIEEKWKKDTCSHRWIR